MTQDEIIEMAIRANATDIGQGTAFHFYRKELETFAKLVAAKEREACAKVCDAKDEIWAKAGIWNPVREYKECAVAIRARGEA